MVAWSYATKRDKSHSLWKTRQASGLFEDQDLSLSEKRLSFVRDDFGEVDELRVDDAMSKIDRHVVKDWVQHLSVVIKKEIHGLVRKKAPGPYQGRYKWDGEQEKLTSVQLEDSTLKNDDDRRNTIFSDDSHGRFVFSDGSLSNLESTISVVYRFESKAIAESTSD